MPQSTSFQVRIVAGVSIFFVDGMSLDILDVTNRLLCVYDYRGVSKSLSLPASASFRGPWNAFTTRVPTAVDRFGGRASFASVGGLDNSQTAFEMSPFGSCPTVTIVPFATGFTAGLSMGVGIGALSRMFPAVPAEKAPFPHNV